jgi:hypothetical protein
MIDRLFSDAGLAALYDPIYPRELKSRLRFLPAPDHVGQGGARRWLWNGRNGGHGGSSGSGVE